MGRYFVETRCDGLPWTREGCNAWEPPKRLGWAEWTSGRHLPYASEADARAAIERMKTDRATYDDPTWARAEYRIVPEKRGGK